MSYLHSKMGAFFILQEVLIMRNFCVLSFAAMLLVCAVTENDDDYGNTFFSEIDVIARSARAPAGVRFGPGVSY